VERLQKILSHAGVASRRAAEQLMLDGRVSVNGLVVRELGTKADPMRDEIRVDGRRVRAPERRLYILLNKPRGYLTTRSDPQRRPTVLDLLHGVPEYVYPVGRLDFESQGLLILTNDGELAAGLTHPRNAVPRTYEATVLGIPDSHDLERLARGIVIEGRRTLPAVVTLVHPARGSSSDTAVINITISEGRNRQVRKMCEAIGHPVVELTRLAIGSIRDPKLKPGRWRNLTEQELRALRVAGARLITKPRSSRRPRERS
jgi:23S rRNA pseudouridine2605 synthase